MKFNFQRKNDKVKVFAFIENNKIIVSWGEGVVSCYSLQEFSHAFILIASSNIVDPSCTFYPKGQCDRPDKEVDACKKCKQEIQ